VTSQASKTWIASLAALAFASCGSGGLSQSWPAGTVLVVGKTPITVEDVDEYTPMMALLEPQSSEKQLRRLALTQVVLPRTLGRDLADPAERDHARKAAENALADLRAAKWVGPPAPDSSGGTLLEGNLDEIGMARWKHAIDLEQDQWSEPFEELGCYTIIKRLGRTDGPVPLATRFKLEVVSFIYLPLETGSKQVQEAYDKEHLEILDPEWRSIVPELLQYKMGAHSP
jgi:hypothetical protein